MLNNFSFLTARVRKLILFLIDILMFVFVSAVYFLLSYKLDPSISYEPLNYVINGAILLATTLILRLFLRIYTSVWRYTNTLSYLRLLIADTSASVIAFAISKLFGFHIYIWFFAFISPISLLATMSSRLIYRFLYKRMHCRSDYTESEKINVAIVGAGQIGAMLVAELNYRESKYRPCFFIDKNPSKVGSRVASLAVYANDREKLPELLKKHGIKEIFIAISRLDNDTATDLFNFYSGISCKVKLYDIPVKDFDRDSNGKPINRTIRKFQIEDLLFRKTIDINDTDAKNYYSGKTVLVTGGGGSIGSEICRQLAKCCPKKLIILDIYENNAYDIQQELIRKYGNQLDLDVEIASVRDRDRLDDIFKYYRPNIVFHAAAHKHVPLMEKSATEAIKNNVLGTYNTADMAEKYGVEKFILISTDKAVNPTNVMGASKRMCEMVIQCRTDSKTSFAAVRFGNVLGSNGSVIPLFRKQIEAGGPVTITDKRIIRYFMTIPEASQLVMQAGAMAKKGELFVLDMGKPVRIYDLAVNMIKLSGFEPDVDIEIKEIGLRPGEKLYEELLMKTEALDKTENNMIFIEKDTPLTRGEVEDKLDILRQAVRVSNAETANDTVKNAIKQVVPTFHEPEELNKEADKSEEVKMASVNA